MKILGLPLSGSSRVKALKALDCFLHWLARSKIRDYPASSSAGQEEWICANNLDVEEFTKRYGYFSPLHPITAKVTSDDTDILPICSLLKTLYEKKTTGSYLEIALAEILTKVLAYRDLKAGQILDIPVEIQGELFYERFKVDCVFNLWHGMPAFGLIPQSPSMASILLFRGTDFTFVSKRGWASILSDLDRKGPGFSVFKSAQGQIAAWLSKAAALGKKAKAMGFSLGGALAAYTFIEEHSLLSTEPSIAVCGPGLTFELIGKWRALPLERQNSFISYVNAGDVVPQIGQLCGKVYSLCGTDFSSPLSAHTMLICSQPLIGKKRVL